MRSNGEIEFKAFFQSGNSFARTLHYIASNYIVDRASEPSFAARHAFCLMAEEFIFIGRNKQNRQAAAKIRKTTTTEAGNLYKPSVAPAACTYTQGRAGAGAQCKLNALLGGRAKVKKNRTRPAPNGGRAGIVEFFNLHFHQKSAFKKSSLEIWVI